MDQEVVDVIDTPVLKCKLPFGGPDVLLDIFFDRENCTWAPWERHYDAK